MLKVLLPLCALLAVSTCLECYFCNYIHTYKFDGEDLVDDLNMNLTTCVGVATQCTQDLYDTCVSYPITVEAIITKAEVNHTTKMTYIGNNCFPSATTEFSEEVCDSLEGVFTPVIEAAFPEGSVANNIEFTCGAISQCTTDGCNGPNYNYSGAAAQRAGAVVLIIAAVIALW